MKSILHMGDSLSRGFLSNSPWPWRARALKNGTAWAIDPNGVSGERLDQIATRYTTHHRNKGHTHFSVWGGINDILQDATAATAYARLKAMTDAALADGQNLVICTLAPFKNYTGYSAARDGRRVDFNNLLIAAVQPGGDMAGGTLVRLDTALADPGDSALLLAAYNGGDALHLSAAGEDAVAAAYVAAVP